MYFAGVGRRPAKHKPAMLTHEKPMFWPRYQFRNVQIASVRCANMRAHIWVVHDRVNAFRVVAPQEHQLISRPDARMLTAAAADASVEINPPGCKMCPTISGNVYVSPA